MCVGAWEGQKNVSDPLDVELEMVVSYHVAAGNRTQLLFKSQKYS